MLAVIQTHPVQYHAPVYRAVEQNYGVPVTAIYGSDFSVAGYRDLEFGTTFAWDTDLLSGYSSIFLSRVSDGGAKNFNAISARGMSAALSRLAPSAVVVCGYSPHFHRAAFFHAWRTGVPILFRAETTDTTGDSALRHKLRSAALSSLYANCARVLYVGQRSRRHYEALGVKSDHLVFSPYCVDTDPFEVDESARLRLRLAMRRDLQVGERDLVILFSGKLTPKKRPDLLLEALRRLTDQIDQRVVAVFLGDGELRPDLETLSRATPQVRVHFAGFKKQRELSPYYHAADLLVLPSQHSETWGLVVNEALSHGLPCVVSSAVGCSDDLIVPGKTGHVFPVGDGAALAATLRESLSLVDRVEIRAACRATVERYSVDRAASGIAEAYRLTMDHHAGG